MRAAVVAFIAAIVAVFAAGCAAVSQGHALTATNGKDTVRVTDQPCTSQIVLRMVNPQYREVLRDATATVRGQAYRACWFVDVDHAHLLYEDGDQGLVPLADFKPGAGL
jgi:hypothetical protein